MPAKCPLTIYDLAPFFQFPIEDAAQRLGVCVTVLKKVCRAFGMHARQSAFSLLSCVCACWANSNVAVGIRRWPLQRLRYLDQRLSQYGSMAQWTPEIKDEVKKLLNQRAEMLNGLTVGMLDSLDECFPS
jgi:hypothetical protein